MMFKKLTKTQSPIERSQRERDCKVSFSSPLQLSSPVQKYSPGRSHTNLDFESNQSTDHIRKNMLLVSIKVFFINE